MQCLIIDDNPKTCVRLIRLLEPMAAFEKVHHAVHPYLVRSLMCTAQIDIVFIRVRLWSFRQFEGLRQMPVIVFLSGGKTKLTHNALTCVPYLLREPYHPAVMSSLMVNIVADMFREPPEYLFLRYDGRYHKTMFSDIEMIERLEKNYCRFCLRYGASFIPGSLPGWLAKLPATRFIRVSDTLVLPTEIAGWVTGSIYEYKGRSIPLTFRFTELARNEMEHHTE